MPLKVEGLRKFVKDLETTGIEVTDLKKAFAQISGEARTLAAGFAPRKSGALQRSIRGSTAKNYAAVTAGGKAVRYAGPINYGWKARGIRSSAFMEKADMSIRPRVMPILTAAINTLLREKNLS